MPQLNQVDKNQEHHHVWRTDGFAQDNCIAKDNGDRCKWVRISASECEYRKNEWTNYFQLVNTSNAYRDFMEMKEAFKSKNMPDIKNILARVETRCKPVGEGNLDEPMYKFKEDEYLQKPHYPDPTTWTYYQVEGSI